MSCSVSVSFEFRKRNEEKQISPFAAIDQGWLKEKSLM